MKQMIKTLIFSATVLLLLSGFGVLLKTKRRVETAVDNYHDEHEGFYDLEKDTVDVLYIGSSHSFSSISPEDIYKKYGITGYVQGSSCQKVWQSYYYLEEFLYTQHPKIVILDTFMALDGGAQSEPFNREAIDKMRMSPAKLKSAWMAKRMNVEEEDFISYIFPALRYHDRWKELSDQDYKYIFMPRTSSAKGFLPRQGSVAAEFNIKDYNNKTEVQTLNGTCADYLNKIKKLCDTNGMEFILVKWPTCLWSLSSSLTIEQWANENDVRFLDFIANKDLRAAVNIDWNVDSLDGGNHLNYEGAMKMTDWMGAYLTTNYVFEDKRNNENYMQWDEDYIYYKKCVKNAELKSQNEFDMYLNNLEEEDYLVVVSFNGVNDNVDDQEKNKILKIGIPEKILEHQNESNNLTIISNGKLVYSQYGENVIQYTNCICGFDLDVTSETKQGGSLSCIYERSQKAIDQTGIQFIVFDPVTDKYVDTSVWAVDESGKFNRM